MSLMITTTLTTEARAAQSQIPTITNLDIGPTRGEVVLVVVGIAAVGALIGVGTYYGIKHNRTLTGCAASGPNGMELMAEGDHLNYTLMGDIAQIKAGERVRVSGKKRKHDSDSHPFLVEKVKRDFGPCDASLAQVKR
jgi:Na+-transporting NADH:ubiquinone oxidoreductase subunit NqrD